MYVWGGGVKPEGRVTSMGTDIFGVTSQRGGGSNHALLEYYFAPFFKDSGAKSAMDLHLCPIRKPRFLETSGRTDATRPQRSVRICKSLRRLSRTRAAASRPGGGFYWGQSAAALSGPALRHPPSV